MQSWIQLIGALVALGGAVALILSKIRDLHIHVNSRLTELIELTKSAATAEGVTQGRKLAGQEEAERMKEAAMLLEQTHGKTIDTSVQADKMRADAADLEKRFEGHT